MAFSTIPFAGTIQNNVLDFNWCSVSPTKAFIVFTGTTTAPAVRKLFIQAVYFDGKNAATFGPACAVMTVSSTGYTFPSIAALGDGRLFVTLQETSATTFSYLVLDVANGDMVSLSYKHPALFTQFGNGGHINVVGLDSNKVLTTQFSSTTNDYQVITVGPSSLSFQNLTGALLYAASAGDNIGPITQLFGHTIRRDYAGNILIARAYVGSSISGGITNGVQLTTFTKAGVPSRYGMLLASPIGGVDNSGRHHGRDIFPVSTATLLSLGAKQAGGAVADGSIGGENGFTRLFLSVTNSAWVGSDSLIPWRDTTPVKFDDVIWLDDDYFFAIASLMSTSALLGARGGATWSVAPSNACKQVAYIGKYNKNANSIILGDAVPLALPGSQYYATVQSHFLHRISNTEVAILQPSYNGSNYELNVTVIGA